MSREFQLPDIGSGLQEAEIIEWHVSVGDTVSADQVLCEVETEKSVVEIPVPFGGIVLSLAGPVAKSEREPSSRSSSTMSYSLSIGFDARSSVIASVRPSGERATDADRRSSGSRAAETARRPRHDLAPSAPTRRTGRHRRFRP